MYKGRMTFNSRISGVTKSSIRWPNSCLGPILSCSAPFGRDLVFVLVLEPQSSKNIRCYSNSALKTTFPCAQLLLPTTHSNSTLSCWPYDIRKRGEKFASINVRKSEISLKQLCDSYEIIIFVILSQCASISCS
uniref:HDC10777 n=1 Tax=Drosophila melanogaster TaxID=7227 RepID=Q6IL15_DROME|nr:TPA_inf: HDC10777 [Drosophila melanogaster]